ncbi:MAG: hypothetical protein GDA52_11485 [Rhodobacteraceae bacterium]|nr:hypothetical protein [Paracoccaceae bacterium]
MAGEAIPDRQVDKSPIRWDNRTAVVDGSNVAHWGDDNYASLDSVKAILQLLKAEGVTPTVVFDANIGYKVANRHMDQGELAAALGGSVDVELVQSGTVADRRIVELAEQRKAIIVSNDLFRDSLRAPHPETPGVLPAAIRPRGTLAPTGVNHARTTAGGRPVAPQDGPPSPIGVKPPIRADRVKHATRHNRTGCRPARQGQG